MPPWGNLTPQQQQMLLQILQSRGTAGMQMPGAMQPGMMPGETMANNPLMNPAAGQMNPAMNQQLMQYMLALRGQPGIGQMAQPTMAQMLSPQGGNTWGLGL